MLPSSSPALNVRQVPDSATQATAAVSLSPLLAAKVAAVVVIYFPQGQLLHRLVSSIADQVDAILLIDNTPGLQAHDPRSTLPRCKDLRYLPQGRNLGVATAINVGLEVVLNADYTHVVLFDQDSKLPASGIRDLLSAERTLLDQGQMVAAVAPIYVDEKSGQRVSRVFYKGFMVHRTPIALTEENPIETDSVISSGALIRTSVLPRVGPMLDQLFIDLVDTEWAYRAKGLGLHCYLVPRVVMTHSIGEHVKSVLGKTLYLHSPIRDYYIIRNTIYLIKGHRMSRDWRRAQLIIIPKYFISRLLAGPNRLKRLSLMLWAIYQATLGSMRNLL